MAQADYLIEIRNMSKAYEQDGQTVRALDDISLRVRQGEFIAVTGPAGAGKSTLMQLIGCLEAPDTGSYLLDGRDVYDMPDLQLAQIRNQKIGFIFQEQNMLPTLSLEENLALPLAYAGIPRADRKERIDAVLEQMRLTERRKRLPHMLSRGERQLAAVARALVNDPSLILADEPTEALDPDSMRAVVRCMEELHAAEKTLLLITHDQDVALCAKRMIEMREGRIVYDNANVWGGDAE